MPKGKDCSKEMGKKSMPKGKGMPFPPKGGKKGKGY